MINKLIKKYNALEGRKEVKRSEIDEIRQLALDWAFEGSAIGIEISLKLKDILNKYDSDKFEIKSLKKYSLQKTTSVSASKQGKKEKVLPGNSTKNKKQETGLNAPRHNGSAKNALSECGRLKKGFRYEKGGKIVKVKKQPKKKSTEKPVKKRAKKESVKKPKKVEKTKLKPVKVDTNGQTALFGAVKEPLINFEVVESTNMVLEPVKESTPIVTPVLNAPVSEVPLKVSGREVKKEAKQVTSKSRFKTSFELLNDEQVQNELFTINNPYWSKFLGKVEKKPKQSMVITIDSGEGGGKTHSAFQFAQVMASSGYRPIIWSLEEHKDSNLSKDKQRKYFDEDTQKIIVVESEDNDLTYEQNFTRIKESVSEFDVIIIDSYAKLQELNSKINFDTDFRKKFNGKLFFVIFQRTADGKMRGGAKGAFDGDIILKVDVDRADFRNNFIFNHKNRYNDYMPISELKFSPFHQKLIGLENEPTVTNNSQQQPVLLNFEVVG